MKVILLLPCRYPLVIQSLPRSHTGYSVVNSVTLSLPSRYPLVTHWFPVLVRTPSFKSFGETWPNFYSFKIMIFLFHLNLNILSRLQIIQSRKKHLVNARLGLKKSLRPFAAVIHFPRIPG